MDTGQRVAVVQLCVDDRLDHGKIRAEVAKKLRGVYVAADRILLVNEIGGNFGENFRNAVEMFRSLDAQIVFCAVLHHDDCGAAAAGRRRSREQTLAEMSAYLAGQGVICPVYAGNIQTNTNEVSW